MFFKFCVLLMWLSGGDNGGMLSINIGWGLGVLVGVLIAGPVSGKDRLIIEQTFLTFPFQVPI